MIKSIYFADLYRDNPGNTKPGRVLRGNVNVSIFDISFTRIRASFFLGKSVDRGDFVSILFPLDQSRPFSAPIDSQLGGGHSGGILGRSAH